ncbi:pectate lyase [Aliifodinibius sp. S!AR15-10]|uniref:pectate lyase n=1 Tax=Aliifodinibius sp. S!AR15-10 TaxID=2950437 RepID=UPI0028613F57|nr:pectate lyase [Aliifodinibius sp. S!AR15-10]MDR8389684.1 pectate lyase [Aliifodinibius sp. S!AR15-10]
MNNEQPERSNFAFQYDGINPNPKLWKVKMDLGSVLKLLCIHLLLIISFISCDEKGQSGGAVAVDPIDWDDALEQEAEWYQGSEAVRIADNVLLYQHESGGWPKNLDMAQVLSEADKDSIRKEQAEGGTTLSNITIDNGATYTQMRYLARVYNATGHDRFRESFERGVDYLVEAQYDTGGWPQYYPIREGYYEMVTFNDGAMIGAMRMLRDVAEGEDLYSFVDSDRRQRASVAIEKGIEAILDMQIMQDGQRTAWCAQHDPETLEPAWARSYEPPSFAGAASVGIVRFLMAVEEPTPEIIAAVEDALEWYRDTAIHGYRYEEFIDEEGREDKRLVEDPDTGPLWARFYEIGTNRPIFMNRDSDIFYEYSKVPQERRGGYDWYGDWAEELLEEEYPQWSVKHNPSSE